MMVRKFNFAAAALWSKLVVINSVLFRRPA